MELITDRTQEDVLLRNSKGSYGADDLNRVENAVEVLSRELAALGEYCQPLNVKTDWQLVPLFCAGEWPVREQMERYLGNVRQLALAYGLEPQLPQSMERLNWQGANQIESQLKLLLEYMENQKAARRFCGAAECGG